MKKALSLLLALTLVLGMSVTSFAAITIDKDENTGAGFGGIEMAIDPVDPGSKHTSTIVNFKYKWDEKGAPPSTHLGYTTSGKFYPWTDAELLIANGIKNATPGSPAVTGLDAKKKASLANKYGKDVTVDSLPANMDAVGFGKKDLPKVVARTRVSKGANCIKGAEIVFDSVAKVQIEFVKPFVNNNPDGQEFSVWVYPVVDGKAWPFEKYGVNFTGTLKNPTTEVDKNTDYVDMYTGNIAKITDNIRAIKYDLGPESSAHDIVLHGKAIKGQKYWGVANNDVSEADAELMDKHKIDQVYHLQQAGGLDKVTNNVVIATATKNDFIFDGDLKFLGKGDSKTIPYAATYYIANHMIEVASDEEPLADEPTTEAVDPIAEVPVTGGTAAAPAGVFQNPSTGA